MRLQQRALVWIGSEAALTDADSAAALTVAEKPLGALMWMKNDENMKAHDVWRANNQISQTSCGHEALYESLEQFIPDLASRLRLQPPPEKEDQPSPLVSLRHPAVNNYGQTNPLTAVLSAGVDGLDGMGCYQLGLEVTPKALQISFRDSAISRTLSFSNGSQEKNSEAMVTR